MSKKTLWAVIVIVVVVLLIWWVMASKQAVAPANENIGGNETSTASIGTQLNGINDADMNAEFKDIDASVSKL